MEILVEFANKLGVMAPKIIDFFSSIIIIPEPFKSIIGNAVGSFLTVIAPIWNPLWSDLNEALELFFGFPV